MDIIVLYALPEHAGERIDVFVSQNMSQPELSRSMAARLCEQGLCEVNGTMVGKNYKIKSGDEVGLSLPPPKPIAAAPQDIPLTVVYEDGALLVVDKPKGMVVHPAAGNEEGTLVNALLHHCGGSLSGIGGMARPGIVHRIDKDTSGLLVVAKTDAAHNHLSEQVKARSVTRIYHAIAYGRFSGDEGTIEAPIGRHPTDRKRMCVTVKNSRAAVTHYTVHRRFAEFTYLICRLQTGRTHQIRVHLRHIGHPVAGDAVYGPKKVIASLGGQCLHAHTLGFVHPGSGEYMEFSSALPPYFTEFIAKLGPEI